MHTLLVAWVLGMMVSLQPVVGTPWAVTYGQTADAIVRAAEDAPLFKGPDGIARTVVLLVSVASFESRFDPSAKGDGGASLGLFQVQPATAAVRAEMLLEPHSASTIALGVMRQSFRVCASLPQEERLAWYAAGGPSCRASGVEKARHRWARAVELLKKFPPPPA